MALNSYAALQTTVMNWLARPGDTLISGSIPDMIKLFEAEAQRRLKTRWQETTASLLFAAGDSSATLPSDFQMLRSIRLTSNDPILNLYYLTPGQLTHAWAHTFTIEGEALRLVEPVEASTTVTIGYIQGLSELSSLNTTNWLLTNHPDVYLFGVLCEAEPFVGNDERFVLWKMRRDEAFDSIVRADRAARWPGGSLQIRTDLQMFRRNAGEGGVGGEAAAMTTFTLSANTTTSIMTNPRIRSTSYIQLSPLTENAAQAMVMGVWIVPEDGGATINHVSSPAADMNFTVLIF
jgi:hypothetical protein